MSPCSKRNSPIRLSFNITGYEVGTALAIDFNEFVGNKISKHVGSMFLKRFKTSEALFADHGNRVVRW